MDSLSALLGRVLINSVHVRFAPKATEILRCREMTRCASCGLMQRSKKSIIRLSCRRAIRASCGNFKADRPRGLEIDDQLEVRRLLDRYIGTLGSAQNFSRPSCPLSQELGKPRTKPICASQQIWPPMSLLGRDQ